MLNKCVAPLVEVKKVEFICPQRPGGNIVLDLQQNKSKKGEFIVNEEYVLKEKTINCLQLTFKVHNDIVYGLKFCMTVKKYGVTSKDEEVVGTFSPTQEEHVF